MGLPEQGNSDSRIGAAKRQEVSKRCHELDQFTWPPKASSVFIPPGRTARKAAKGPALTLHPIGSNGSNASCAFAPRFKNLGYPYSRLKRLRQRLDVALKQSTSVGAVQVVLVLRERAISKLIRCNELVSSHTRDPLLVLILTLRRVQTV